MIPYSECSVNFSIINACSCKCWFCGCVGNHQPASKATRLTLEDIQRTFRATPPGEKLREIFLSGAGESVMNPECVEIAAFLKGQTEHLILFSNGVLLTPEISEKLIAAGVDEIRVSITGVTPEVWRRNQGCGFGEKADEILPRVLNNIKAMCENRDRINPKCVTGTNYMLREDNEDHLLLYLQTMKDLGVSNVQVQPYVNGSCEEDNPPKRYLVERIARRMLKGLPLCAGIGDNMQTDIQKHPGEILACCSNYSPSISLGNILEQPIYEILTGEKFRTLCDALGGGKSEIPQTCLDCLYRRPHLSAHLSNRDGEEKTNE